MKYGVTDATVHLLNENYFIGDTVQLKVLLHNKNCSKEVTSIDVVIKQYIEAYALGNNQYLQNEICHKAFEGCPEQEERERFLELSPHELKKVD